MRKRSARPTCPFLGSSTTRGISPEVESCMARFCFRISCASWSMPIVRVTRARVFRGIPQGRTSPEPASIRILHATTAAAWPPWHSRDRAEVCRRRNGPWRSYYSYYLSAQKGNISTETEENSMRITKEDIPVRINVPGAVARQKANFGDATGYGKISGEYFSLAAGTDISPLLEGLEGDLCQSPHWGYLLQGKLTVTYTDGTQEVNKGGDLFYWPPGHTVTVGEAAAVILFSPQDEHRKVIDHMLKKRGA